MLFLLFSIYGSAYATILLHEGAHLLCAWLLGFSIKGIHIGFWRAVTLPSHPPISLGLLPLKGKIIAITDRRVLETKAEVQAHFHKVRWRIFWMTLAGPLATLLQLIACQIAGWTVLYEVGLFFLISGMLSDGRLLLAALRGRLPDTVIGKMRVTDEGVVQIQ